MNSGPRIAGAGICCLDHIIVAPKVPWGDTGRIKSYCTQGGGLVATALVACARLGASCEIFTLVGNDQVGDYLTRELDDEGISTAGVMRVEGELSRFSFIHVDAESGDRTIYHYRNPGLVWRPGMCDLGSIADCAALLIDDVYPDLALAAADVARAHGIPVVGDMTPGPGNMKLMPVIDVMIAPRHFARRIGCETDLDAALDAIHEMGPSTAVITLGADGWAYSDPTGRGRGEAFPVEVVDTTGAGDSFHGAFAYGLAVGWDTARCAEFAAAVAAIKCGSVGGRTGLPTLEQTLDFLRKRSKLDWSDVT